MITPETHPKHHTVGKYFKGHGVIYYCDSYDPEIGYWMTPVFGEKDFGKTERTNVSERAIGRTFHEIWQEFGTFLCRHNLDILERGYMERVYND